MMAQATAETTLTFTMNVAQLVILGGLVWRLAEMSSAVKALTKVTEKLTLATDLVSDGLNALIIRVAVLEDRESSRRDRRHDDVRG